MKLKTLTQYIFPVCFLLYSDLSFSQKISSDKLDSLRRRVLIQYFGVAKTLDAEATSNFSYGNIILRKNGQYAVMSEFGHFIVPYGKYLFDGPFRSDLPQEGNNYFHFDNWMARVRSPETGLYGFIDPKGEEVIPLRYNETSPVARLEDNAYIPAAIGTRFAANGKRETVLLSAYLQQKEIPVKNEELAKQLSPKQQPANWIIERQYKYDGIHRFFDLAGDPVMTTRRKAQYYGNGFFRIDSTFNDLQKTTFINAEGNVVIPFQISKDFLISRFQKVVNNRTQEISYISVLEGLEDENFFKYALMDGTGKIYSRLGVNDEYTNISLEGGKDIRGNCLLVSAQKQGERGYYLWNVTEEKKLVNIQKLFEENNRSYLEQFGTDNIKNYRFEYVSREGGYRYIKFYLNIRYKPNPAIIALNPWGTKLSPGGINGVDWWVVDGYGLMDQETGKIVVPPVFSKIEAVDPHSRTAYAELVINNKTYKGFIETVDPETAMVRFIYMLKPSVSQE